MRATAAFPYLLVLLLLSTPISAQEDALEALDIDAAALEYTCPSTDELVTDLEMQVSTLKNTIQVLEERLISQAERDGTEVSCCLHVESGTHGKDRILYDDQFLLWEEDKTFRNQDRHHDISSAFSFAFQLKTLRQKLSTAAKLLQLRNKEVESKEKDLESCRTSVEESRNRGVEERKAAEEQSERLHRLTAACKLRLTDASAARVEAERHAERLETRLREAEEEGVKLRQRVADRELVAGEADTLAQQLVQESAARKAATSAAAEAKAALMAALEAVAARERLAELERVHASEILPYWLSVRVGHLQETWGVSVQWVRKDLALRWRALVDALRHAYETHAMPLLEAGRRNVRDSWARLDAKLQSQELSSSTWMRIKWFIEDLSLRAQLYIRPLIAQVVLQARRLQHASATLLWHLSSSPRLPAWARDKVSFDACKQTVVVIALLAALTIVGFILAIASVLFIYTLIPARVSARPPSDLAQLEQHLRYTFRKPEILAEALGNVKPGQFLHQQADETALPEALGRSAIQYLRLRHGSNAARSLVVAGKNNASSSCALARFAAEQVVEEDVKGLANHIGPLVTAVGRPGRKPKKVVAEMHERATLAVLGAVLIDSGYDVEAVAKVVSQESVEETKKTQPLTSGKVSPTENRDLSNGESVVEEEKEALREEPVPKENVESDDENDEKSTASSLEQGDDGLMNEIR